MANARLEPVNHGFVGSLFLFFFQGISREGRRAFHLGGLFMGEGLHEPPTCKVGRRTTVPQGKPKGESASEGGSPTPGKWLFTGERRRPPPSQERGGRGNITVHSTHPGKAPGSTTLEQDVIFWGLFSCHSRGEPHSLDDDVGETSWALGDPPPSAAVAKTSKEGDAPGGALVPTSLSRFLRKRGRWGCALAQRGVCRQLEKSRSSRRASKAWCQPGQSPPCHHSQGCPSVILHPTVL